MNVGRAYDRHSRGAARRAASTTAWRGVHIIQHILFLVESADRGNDSGRLLLWLDKHVYRYPINNTAPTLGSLYDYGARFYSSYQCLCNSTSTHRFGQS